MYVLNDIDTWILKLVVCSACMRILYLHSIRM